MDSVDILKFLMSIAIVAIHSGLGGAGKASFIYPWARIAVPVFFIVSAYLFFRKYNAGDADQKKARLKKFITRNMQLYAFWLVVLLIPTLMIRKWFDAGLLFGFIEMVRSFLFGSTFVASWYIMATVIAICIIAALMKHLSNRTMLIIFVLCYLFACLTSNYWNLIASHEHVAASLKALFRVFGNPYNNFFVALFWVLLGKIIAEHESSIRSAYKNNRCKVIIWLLLVLGCILLLIEQLVISTFGLASKNDCFFMLPIPAICLFIIVLNSNIRTNLAKEMRATSTITYCFHATFLSLLRSYLHEIGFSDYGILEFSLALILSWIITAIILKLEVKPSLKILKYSH